MIDNDLLSILACPETKKELEMVDDRQVLKINQAIEKDSVLTKLKNKVSVKIDGGLFRKGDQRYIYPIRDGVPILLIEELIDLDNIDLTI